MRNIQEAGRITADHKTAQTRQNESRSIIEQHNLEKHQLNEQNTSFMEQRESILVLSTKYAVCLHRVFNLKLFYVVIHGGPGIISCLCIISTRRLISVQQHVNAISSLWWH